jgi:hypothetical protein
MREISNDLLRYFAAWRALCELIFSRVNLGVNKTLVGR